MKKLFIALIFLPIYSMSELKDDVIPEIKISINKSSVRENKTQLPNAIEDDRHRKLRHYPVIFRAEPHLFITRPSLTASQRYALAAGQRVGAVAPLPINPTQPIVQSCRKFILTSLCAGVTMAGAITGFIYWYSYAHSH